MKARLLASVILLAFGGAAFAHRLDEYLQATTLSVEKDRVSAQIRLTPGVAVFPALLARIDANADGAISDAERRTYAERVMGDLSLEVDGTPVRLRLVSSRAATVQQMKEGRGAIELEIEATVPCGGHQRRLVFENRHDRRIAAYLVNSLVPRDPDIRITAQTRNYEQSEYQLEYVDASASRRPCG